MTAGMRVKEARRAHVALHGEATPSCAVVTISATATALVPRCDTSCDTGCDTGCGDKGCEPGCISAVSQLHLGQSVRTRPTPTPARTKCAMQPEANNRSSTSPRLHPALFGAPAPRAPGQRCRED